MKATVLLFFLIVTLTLKDSNSKCIERIELVCNRVPDCDNKCQRRKYEARSMRAKSIDLMERNPSVFIYNKSPAIKKPRIFRGPIFQLSRRIPVQPMIRKLIPIVNRNNYLQPYSLDLENRRKKKSKKLCRRYECHINTCKKKCQDININGPTDFKLIDSVRISDEDTNLSPEFDECSECFYQSPLCHYDEIIDSTPSLDDFDYSQRQQYHCDEDTDIPSFDEFDEPQQHCDEIDNDSVSSICHEFDEPQHHYDEMNDSIQSFDDCADESY